MKKLTSGRLSLVVGLVAILGVLMSSAIVGAATNSGNTTINATVNAVISLSTSGTVNIGLTPTSGGVVSSASDTVSVSTNNTVGYALTLADSDATTTLVSGANTIAAHTGTFAAPTTLSVGNWGYRIVSAGGFGASAYVAETNNGSSTSTWAGVPATGSAQTIKTTATTASNDVTTVWYGVKVDSTKPTGTYSDTVTYTAVTN